MLCFALSRSYSLETGSSPEPGNSISPSSTPHSTGVPDTSSWRFELRTSCLHNNHPSPMSYHPSPLACFCLHHADLIRPGWLPRWESPALQATLQRQSLSSFPGHQAINPHSILLVKNSPLICGGPEHTADLWNSFPVTSQAGVGY